MRDRLLSLREQLLIGGISPRHVDRYIRELSEHRDDIAEHLRESGLSSTEAYSCANHRLGDSDVLLLPMLADRRFRSRAARWPALFYLAMPLLAHLTLIVGGVLALLCAAGTGLRPAIADLGTGLALLLLVSPIVIAWLTLLAAQRRRASLRWPMLGVLSGALVSATLQVGVTPPRPDTAGQIGLTLGTPPLILLLVLLLLSVLPIFLQPRPE